MAWAGDRRLILILVVRGNFAPRERLNILSIALVPRFGLFPSQVATYLGDVT